jgi:two-component system response regulator NreC
MIAAAAHSRLAPAEDVPEPISIVLADDHQVVRRGLRMLLDAEVNFAVVAEAGDVAGSVRKVLAFRPDVLLLDINMAGESSLGSIQRIREASPATAIVVLTMQDDPAFAREALRAGAVGYVLKEAADVDLAAAIRAAAAGGTYLHPGLGARIAAAETQPGATPDRLTKREAEVLQLIALGHTNGEIAERLYLSVRTVESHRAHIQQKTGRTARAELVAYARQHGLV